MDWKDPNSYKFLSVRVMELSQELNLDNRFSTLPAIYEMLFTVCQYHTDHPFGSHVVGPNT